MKPRALEGGAGQRASLVSPHGRASREAVKLDREPVRDRHFQDAAYFLHDVQQIDTVVKFEAVRSLDTPATVPVEGAWGVVEVRRKNESSNCSSPSSLRQPSGYAGLRRFMLSGLSSLWI
jgi:hypothetical protein